MNGLVLEATCLPASCAPRLKFESQLARSEVSLIGWNSRRATWRAAIGRFAKQDQFHRTRSSERFVVCVSPVRTRHLRHHCLAAETAHRCCLSFEPTMASWASKLSNARPEAAAQEERAANGACEEQSMEVSAFAEAAAAGNEQKEEEFKLDALIVDSNALIKGVRIEKFRAREVVTVSEVLGEVRDRNARHMLGMLPFELKVEEPSAEALKAGKINWEMF